MTYNHLYARFDDYRLRHYGVFGSNSRLFHWLNTSSFLQHSKRTLPVCVSVSI